MKPTINWLGTFRKQVVQNIQREKHLSTIKSNEIDATALKEKFKLPSQHGRTPENPAHNVDALRAHHDHSVGSAHLEADWMHEKYKVRLIKVKYN